MHAGKTVLSAALALASLSLSSIAYAPTTDDVNKANNPLTPMLTLNLQDIYVDSYYDLAKQQAATAAPPAPPPAPGAPLPLGTVVNAPPAGCTPTPVGGVAYDYCGGNYYRAAFQGTQLVYVTAKP